MKTKTKAKRSLRSAVSTAILTFFIFGLLYGSIPESDENARRKRESSSPHSFAETRG